MNAARIRIGFVPLTDAAPIAVAAERGFFARHGVAVELSREPSWATVRDKLAANALDAAHMLAPMPLAATVGVGPFQQPLVTALSLGLGGNAITVSRALFSELARLAPAAPGNALEAACGLARLAALRGARGAPELRFGTVFPVSMHSYLLRHWLAAGGLAREDAVRIRVVPPPRMVAALEAGELDGFCVGEPWSSVAVQRGSGVLLATGHDLWNHAPEKVLGVRLDWAEHEPEPHRALLRALLEAGAWCDAPEHRSELAALLAEPRYVGAPRETLEASLRVPGFHLFARYAASFPWRSHAAWILCQMLRFGQLEKALDVRRVAGDVYRADLHREAARELGLARPRDDEKVEGVHSTPWRAPGRPEDVELGPDLYFDGGHFDAKHAIAWLAGVAAPELRVPLDELAAAQGRLA